MISVLLMDARKYMDETIRPNLITSGYIKYT